MLLWRAGGFSLMEVLISLLLFGLALFGLDAMQMASLKQAKAAVFLHTAMSQLNNMSERLSVPEAQSQLTQQLVQWNEENRTVLPAGFGTVSGVFPHYVLAIYWGMQAPSCGHMQLGEAGCLSIAL